jgi:DNA-directed RNA polymerase specialized sigma24 family protein
LDPDHSTPTPRPGVNERRARAAQARIDAYCNAVHREALRLATRRRGFEADDVAQDVVLEFLLNPEKIMAKHPLPEMFARAATKNTGYDWRRSESIQRGEGARRGRQVISWDLFAETVKDGSRELGYSVDPAEVALGVVGAQEILGHVDDDIQRATLVRTAVFNDRVTEVAMDEDIDHSNVSRRNSQTKKHLRKTLVEGGYVQVP